MQIVCTSSSQNKSLLGLGDKLLQCIAREKFYFGIGAAYTKISSIYFLKLRKKEEQDDFEFTHLLTKLFRWYSQTWQ